MPETRFEELKRYVRFDDDDARALLAFRPVAAPHFTRIAREFYERIREHEEAHAVFSGEEQIERLQRSMVRWMDRLLSGPYDEAYHEQTLAIGRMHVRVGLPQRYMFTAMALIRVALEAVAERELGAEAPKARAALTRLLDLELAIMFESYREDLAEQAKRRDDLEAQSLRTDLTRALRLYETAIDVTPSLVVGIDSGGAIRLFNRDADAHRIRRSRTSSGPRSSIRCVASDARERDGALVLSLLAGPRARGGRGLDGQDALRQGPRRPLALHADREAMANDIVLFAVGTDVTDVRAGPSSCTARRSSPRSGRSPPDSRTRSAIRSTARSSTSRSWSARSRRRPPSLPCSRPSPSSATRSSDSRASSRSSSTSRGPSATVEVARGRSER